MIPGANRAYVLLPLLVFFSSARGYCDTEVLFSTLPVKEQSIKNSVKYRVINLPKSHGYSVGSWMGLHAKQEKSARTVLIGYGIVSEIAREALMLLPQSVDSHYLNKELWAGPLRDTKRIGKFRGSIIKSRQHGKIVINLGSNVGVRAGDCYRVLDAPIMDLTPGTPPLGYEESGLLEIQKTQLLLSYANVLDGEAPQNAHIEYIIDCASLHLRKTLENATLQVSSVNVRIDEQKIISMSNDIDSRINNNHSENLLAKSSLKLNPEQIRHNKATYKKWAIGAGVTVPILSLILSLGIYDGVTQIDKLGPYKISP